MPLAHLWLAGFTITWKGRTVDHIHADSREDCPTLHAYHPIPHVRIRANEGLIWVPVALCYFTPWEQS